MDTMARWAKKRRWKNAKKSLSKRLAHEWNVWRYGSGNGAAEMDKIKRHIWKFVDDANPVRIHGHV